MADTVATQAPGLADGPINSNDLETQRNALLAVMAMIQGAISMLKYPREAERMDPDAPVFLLKEAWSKAEAITTEFDPYI